MLIMALKFLATERLGVADQWQAFARSCANKFLQQQVTPAGLGAQSYPQQGYNLSGNPAAAAMAAAPKRFRPNLFPNKNGSASLPNDSLPVMDEDLRPASSTTASTDAIMSSNYAAATAAAVAAASRMGLKAC
jgi:hypothetical protein